MAGLIAQGLQRPHDLDAVHDARSIVMRPFSNVPTVQVSTHHDVPVRKFRAGPFGNHVGLRLVVMQDASHLEAHPHIVALGHQTRNAPRIHSAHRRRRHTPHTVFIAHASRVRKRVQRVRQGTNEGRHPTMLSRFNSSPGALIVGAAIGTARADHQRIHGPVEKGDGPVESIFTQTVELLELAEHLDGRLQHAVRPHTAPQRADAQGLGLSAIHPQPGALHVTPLPMRHHHRLHAHLRCTRLPERLRPPQNRRIRLRRPAQPGPNLLAQHPQVLHASALAEHMIVDALHHEAVLPGPPRLQLSLSEHRVSRNHPHPHHKSRNPGHHGAPCLL